MLLKTLYYFLITLLLTGCFYDNEPLKLGLSPWIGYEGIYQAKEFGWIDNKVELVEGKLASDTFRHFMNGDIDAAALTIDDALLARSKGIDLSIIAILDVSAGSDIVLAKTPMKNLSDLKGKRIALDNTALGSLILNKMLNKGNLKSNDVSTLFIPPHQQPSAWEKDEIDVAITYEPFATTLLNNNAYYLLSTRDLPEMIFDVLVIRNDKIQGRENTIQNLVDGHFKSLNYLRTNYQDFVYRIASREKISPEDVKRSLGGVIFPSKVANVGYFSPKSAFMNSLSDLNEIMSQQHFIAHKVSLNHLLDPSYLKE